jgi:hypothetical protein
VNGTAGYKEALPVANGILLPVDGDLASLVPDDLEGAVAPLLDQYGISTDGLFG